MSDSIYRHDCDFCALTIEGSTLEEVQRRGRTHIENRHFSEFRQVFADQIGGKPCFDGCGYRFPSGSENDAEFECPNCGHDNFPEFADRHIWWRVEVE